jgi:hypothetical protein
MREQPGFLARLACLLCGHLELYDTRDKEYLPPVAVDAPTRWGKRLKVRVWFCKRCGVSMLDFRSCDLP